MKRIAPALALALLVSACGLGQAANLSSASPDIGQTSSTTTAAPEPAPSTTVTTEAPTTTMATAAPTTTSAAPAGTAVSSTPTQPTTMQVAPYFFVDEAGRHNRTGPFLLPVAREVPSTVAVARRAMEQLLAGPDQGERESIPAISSAIPAGVELLGLTIENGIAEVDLSSEFDIEDDSAAVAARVAQVVFTLTRFGTVEQVRFLQDGMEVKVPTSDGSMVAGAVSRGDYLAFAPAIAVETPIYGGEMSDPSRVTGFAAVFEASFQYALTDDDGRIISEGVVMTTNGMGWGTFDFTIDYEVDRRQRGALIVWAHSAEDGSRIDVREYPLTLVP
jgi:spore germination protein GerM